MDYGWLVVQIDCLIVLFFHVITTVVTDVVERNHCPDLCHFPCPVNYDLCYYKYYVLYYDFLRSPENVLILNVSWLSVVEWVLPYSPVYGDHWYTSNSFTFLMTITLPGSGVLLRLQNILHLLVQGLCIFPSFFRLPAFLAMSPFCFVRWSFM